MTELTLELDNNADQCIHELKHHYGLKTKAQVISKAIAMLKIAAYVDSTDGELIARKGAHETKLTIS